MPLFILQEGLLFPNNSGFLLILIGILSILSLYHFLLYFQHRDSQYLLYSGYAFFILMSQLRHIDEGPLGAMIEYIGPMALHSTLYTEIYYILYIIFAFKFLNVSSQFPNSSAQINKAVYVLIGYIVLKFIFLLLTNNFTLYLRGYYLFTSILFLIMLPSFYLFFKLESRLKYYMISGGLILAICSYASLILHSWYSDNGLSTDNAFYILYSGFILENVLFSLGLGHKQKMILEDRNASQKELMKRLNENRNLREKLQQRFERDVDILTQRAEADRLEHLNLMHKKQLADLKISALRSQMNPHFIFNSLNSIKSYIIDNDAESAVYYLNKFSKLVRKILSASMEGKVHLSEELETAELYINIENIRFNNELIFKINVQKDISVDTIIVPALILQPFIENAIWHGLSSKKGEKKINIEVYKQGRAFLIIDIIDNGIGRQQAAILSSNKLHKRKSVGIEITKDRLSHFSQNFVNEFDLKIIDLMTEQKNANGTCVRLSIPLI